MGASDAGYVKDSPSFGIFWLIKAGGDTALWPRFWSGARPFRLPADLVDVSGGTYVSVGFPANLPAFSSIINGAFETVDIVLSGVDAKAQQLALADRADVDGCDMHMGLIDFDARAQPIGGCDWLAQQIAGPPRVARAGQGEGALRSVIVSATSGVWNRNRAPVDFLGPISQRRRSSDDAICDLLPGYTSDHTVVWPR